jgi:hypothetical protein
LNRKFHLPISSCPRSSQTLFFLKSKSQNRNSGFALPLAIGVGLCLLVLGLVIAIAAQSDRINASQRRETGANLMVTEGAIARVMALLSNRNNAVLLARDYDPINPRTSRNYLGTDGVPDSGDETGTAVDEWTGYNPSPLPCHQLVNWGAPNLPLTGTLGSNGSYVLRAYRYDQSRQQGILLMEGNYRGRSTAVAITITVTPDLTDFPGVVAISSTPTNLADGKSILRGRNVLGYNGNLYYPPNHSANPALIGSAAPGDSTRPDYLDATWAGSADGATSDGIAGKVFACRLLPTIPQVPQGTNLGTLNTSQTLSGAAGGITHYRVDSIALSGTDTLTVDTTSGPVYLYLTTGTIQLNNTAKILNIRTDGIPPRVGDFRIITTHLSGSVLLYDQSCIQNAFLYSFADNLELYTTGPSCPGGRNASFEGVVWAEVIAGAKNNVSNRDVTTEWAFRFNNTIIPGTTAGIAVPDDVSSLADVLEYVDWPARYRFGGIKNWQQVRL